MRHIVVCFLLFVGFSIWAQPNMPQTHFNQKGGRFYALSDSIHMGTVHYLDTVQQTLQWYNASGHPVRIDSLYLHERYPTRAFSWSTNTSIVAHQDTLTVHLRFHPVHNMDYKTYLVIAGKGIGSISVQVKGTGHYPLTYYNRTFNLHEQQLKDTLKAILAENYSSLSYNNARDYMYGTLDQVNNQVQCLYTARKAAFTNRTGATANDFNTEHVWPQSTFGSVLPMLSDLHHLFSTDEDANSIRGNLPFGLVTGATNYQVNGSKRNTANTLFEPRDSAKGPVAKALLYFVTRYENYNNFLSSTLETTCRNWTLTYASTQREKDRNAAVFSAQNNRNPFVDYPHFVERISSFSSNNSTAASVKNFAVLIDTIFFSGALGASDSVSLHLINTGNQAVQFTNFQLNGNGLSFLSNSGQNQTLQPNEVHRVWIKKSNLGFFQGALTFQSDVIGKTSMSIPLRYKSSFPVYFSFENQLEADSSFAYSEAIGGVSTSYAAGVTGNALLLSNFPIQGQGNQTAGIQVQLGALNHRNLLVRWKQRMSGAAAAHTRLEYSFNGNTWLPFEADAQNASNRLNNQEQAFENGLWKAQTANVFYERIADLSAIIALNNNGRIYLRWVAAFGTSNQYEPVNSASYQTSGTQRFEDLEVRSFDVFYPKTTGDWHLTSTWGTAEDGTGNPPQNFTHDFQKFVINKNRNANSFLDIQGNLSQLLIHPNDTLFIKPSAALKTSVLELRGALILEADASGYGQLLAQNTRGNGSIQKQIHLQAAAPSVSENGGGSNNGRWFSLVSPFEQSISALHTTPALMPLGNQGVLFYWNANTNNYEAPAGSSLAQGQSFVLYAGSNASGVFTTALPGKLNFTGQAAQVLTQHSQALGFSNAASLTNIFGVNLEGWNLVGNPFLSNYDLYNWSPGSNIVTQLSIRTPNGYESYSFSEENEPLRYLAPSQAFWIRKNSSAGASTLDFLNERRVIHTTQNAQNKTQFQKLLKFKILVKEDSKKVEETRIYFREEASNAYEESFDVDKMAHEPALYTLAQGKPLMVNSLAEMISDQVIPMNFEASKEGTYTLQLDQSENAQVHEVWLHDKTLNVNHLISTSDYTFQHQAQNDKYRFELTFKASPVGLQDRLPAQQQIWVYDHQVYFELPESGLYTLQLVNLQGQILFESQANALANERYIVNLPSVPKGIYLVTFQSAQRVYTLKIQL